jgi:hypothetical protein
VGGGRRAFSGLRLAAPPLKVKPIWELTRAMMDSLTQEFNV